MSIVFGFTDSMGVTTQVTLRNPDLSNVNRLETEVSARMAMDGTLYSRRRTSQPTVLSWSFHALTRPKVLEFLAFLELSAGQQVRLVDFNGVQWLGKVKLGSFAVDTNETGLSPYGSVRAEYSTIHVEFTGVQQ
jgi:hypothetical protein